MLSVVEQEQVNDLKLELGSWLVQREYQKNLMPGTDEYTAYWTEIAMNNWTGGDC